MFPDFAYDLKGEIAAQQVEIVLKALQKPRPRGARRRSKSLFQTQPGSSLCGSRRGSPAGEPRRGSALVGGEALEHAGSSVGQPAIPTLTRLLRDPDETVRFAAAHAVGMIARENAPQETLEVLLAEFAKGYPPGTDGFFVMTPLWQRWRKCLPLMVSALKSKDPSLRDRSSFVLMLGLEDSRASDAEVSVLRQCLRDVARPLAVEAI